MTFKSLIIFTLVASLGRISAAPLDTGHLDARDYRNGSSCDRPIPSDTRSDLSRRQFENNDTLSSSTFGGPSSVDPFLTSVDPPSTRSSVRPHCTSSSLPSSILSIDPSSVDPLFNPSSTPPVDPSSSTPSDAGPVTITVTSTVFLDPTQSPVPSDSSSSPLILDSTQSPVPSDSSSSPLFLSSTQPPLDGSSSTISGDSSFSTPLSTDLSS